VSDLNAISYRLMGMTAKPVTVGDTSGQKKKIFLPAKLPVLKDT